MSTEPTLSALLNQRHYAKLAEEHAVATRRSIDEKIIATLGGPTTEAGAPKDSGTVSRTVGAYKIAATYALDRKANDEAVKSAYGAMSLALQACFRFPAEVNLKALAELGDADRTQVAAYITTKPKSVSLKLDLVA